MAGINGGLTASIRRKLQDGRTPEEIVQELVAGGLTEVSAQRFVDRALAEHASAPPLPDVPAQAASDSIDQFIQTRQAEAVTTGHKPLIMASLLMCSGIAITGFSYIMADAGERYTLMWGPVAFGLFVYVGAVIKGFTQPRTFAWLAAAGSLAAPIVLGGALWMVAMPGMSEGDVLQMGEVTEASAAPGDAYDKVNRILDSFKNAKSSMAKCDATARLRRVPDSEKMMAYNALMAGFDDEVSTVQICIAGAIIHLDQAPMAAAIYEGWSHSSDSQLQVAAIGGYGELGPDYSESGFGFLADQLQSPIWARRFLVVDSLAKMGPGAKELLQVAAEDDHPEVRATAAVVLKRIQ